MRICALIQLVAIIFLSVVLFLGVRAYAVDGEEAQTGVSLGRSGLEYNARDLRDPFESPFDEKKESGASALPSEEVKPPDLVVQGITWSESGNRAIINNKVVSSGDMLEGAKVMRIDKNGVVVVYKGKQYVLDAPAKKMTGSVQNTEGGTK